MTDYICVDGPLEGRTFRWRRPPRTGEAVTVALLDVDHAVLAVDYRVASEPARSGSLEFVEARDADCHARTPVLSRARGAARRVGRQVPRVAASSRTRMRFAPLR